MFIFDDTALPGPGTLSGSATPIFDKLMEEWQRMFRAVPGDRYGEGYGNAAPGMSAYDSGGYPVPAPVPAFRPDPVYPQSYGSSGGYPVPQPPAAQLGSPPQMPSPQVPPPHLQAAQLQQHQMQQSQTHAAPTHTPQMHSPQVHSPQVHAPQVHAPQQMPGAMPPGPPVPPPGGFGGYGQQPPRPTPVRSELALMPVAGYQSQHLPL